MQNHDALAPQCPNCGLEVAPEFHGLECPHCGEPLEAVMLTPDEERPTLFDEPDETYPIANDTPG